MEDAPTTLNRDDRQESVPGTMRNSTARWLAWVTFGLAAAFLLAGMLFLARTPAELWFRRSPLWPLDFQNLAWLAYSAVGAVIASRHPRNPVGWILCAIGLAWSTFVLTSSYSGYLRLMAPAEFNPSALWLVLAQNMWVLALGLFLFFLVLFPDGHLLSARWRPVLVFFAVAILLAYASIESNARAGQTVIPFSSPFELLGITTITTNAVVSDLANSAILFCFFVGATGLILRLHRSRGDERQQLKWVVYACVCLTVLYVLSALFWDWLRLLDPRALYQSDLFSGIPAAAVIVLIPLAAGIAILKYRLYDINILINRTLVYVPLTAVLAGVLAVSNDLTQKFFVGLTGEKSDLSGIVTTLIIVAAFEPLKKGLQDFVDRHFKELNNPGEILNKYGARVQEVVRVMDSHQVTSHFLEQAVRAFEASGGALFLGNDHRGEPNFVLGEWKGDARVTVPLQSDGDHFGIIELGAKRNGTTYTQDERDALQRNADRVAQALAIVKRLS